MGTGKSTVGRIVAQRLERPFVDTDRAIEESTGLTIAALFEVGETHFRRHEAAVCRRLAVPAGRVIAAGGGALLDPETKEAFAAGGLIVCLTASWEAIVDRVGAAEGRPLFGNLEEAAGLLAARQTHYESLPHHVETTGRRPETVAEEVIALWCRDSST